MPWLSLVLLTLFLNYAWELAQSPFFKNMARLPLWYRAFHCLRSAFGDLIFAFAAYVLVALLFRALRWPVSRSWMGAAIAWVLIGIVVAIAFEHWALSTDRWTYGAAMPTLFGIGLLPLAQWVIVPAVALVYARHAKQRVARAST
jgi:hypothetical protein